MPENVGNNRNQSQSEIDDLIGIPPNWLIRSGIGSLAVVAVILVSMSGFIQYPDKTEATGILSASQPPIEHFSQTSAIIEKVAVKEGDYISAGDNIIYLHNLTDLDHLDSLRGFIADFRAVSEAMGYLKISFPKDLQLGDLQAEYSRLQLNYEAFLNALMQTGVFTQIRTLRQEIQTTYSLIDILKKDQDYLQSEVSLVQKDHQRNTKLWEQEVNSDRELEQSEAALLRIQKQLNAAGQNVLQQRLRIHQMEAEIQNLNEERSSMIAEYLYKIQEVINSLEQKILIWEEANYIKTEISGILSLPSKINQGILISPGDLVFKVAPIEKTEYFVKLGLPSSQMAKIEKGTKALIKFDNFPYKEWGMIKSFVSHIDLVPSPDQDGQMIYELRIALPNKLVTTYGRELEYKPFTGVKVEIITEDRSILERIFDQILNLLNNTTQ
jgi:HlyD family secretion protein